MKPIQKPINQIQASKRHPRSWQSVHHECSYLLQGPIATDAPVFIAPSFENKADVRQNAIDRAISLSLPIDVIHCAPKLQRIGAHAKEKYRDRQTDAAIANTVSTT